MDEAELPIDALTEATFKAIRNHAVRTDHAILMALLKGHSIKNVALHHKRGDPMETAVMVSGQHFETVKTELAIRHP